MGFKIFGLTYWKTRKALFRYLRAPDNKRARRFFSHYRRLMADVDQPRLPRQTFLLVRAPYTRAVSSYIDKFCGDDRDKPWVRDVVKACGVDSPTFIDFLTYVKNTPTGDMDPHWRQQTHAIQGLSDVTILKIETLADDFDQYATIWGDRGKALLTKRHQSNAYDLELPETDASNLTAQTIVEMKMKHGAFPSKGTFLTPQAKSLIETAYLSDFERFGYAFD